MAGTAGTYEYFETFQKQFDQEQEIREKLRASTRVLEQKVRAVQANLQQIHSKHFDVTTVVLENRRLFTDIQAQIQELSQNCPAGQYYKYNDHWRFTIQQAIFLSALTYFLETGRLLLPEEVPSFLGVTVSDSQDFHVDLEDFLTGLCSLSNELSRYVVNRVTAGEYQRAVDVANFLAEMHAGFRLL
eukprot:Colp12_sorted_trinity150504_noHs@32155